MGKLLHIFDQMNNTVSDDNEYNDFDVRIPVKICAKHYPSISQGQIYKKINVYLTDWEYK